MITRTIFITTVIMTSAFAVETGSLYQNAKNSVVLIVSQDANQAPLAIGTGFFFKNKMIATNYHVVRDASSFKIKVIGTSTQLTSARVKSYSESLDLAILETVEEGIPLSLSNGSNVDIGHKIITIGNPRGLSGTVSEGIISGIREIEGVRIFQITAAISPGSSGGPVLLQSGEVLGIATFSISDSQNLNFAMPASFLLQLVQKDMKWDPFRNITPVYKKGNAGIELVLFKKSGPEFKETFSLKNATNNFIKNLTLLFIYKTLRGNVFDFRVATIEDTIPPGLAKMVTQESFDQNQKFSYRTENGFTEDLYERFDIEIRVLSYDIVESERSISDKLLDGEL